MKFKVAHFLHLQRVVLEVKRKQKRKGERKQKRKGERKQKQKGERKQKRKGERKQKRKGGGQIEGKKSNKRCTLTLCF